MNLKKLAKKDIRIRYALPIILLAMATSVYASVSYSIPPQTQMIINEQGICRQVTNQSINLSLFVPTNTSTEWSDFINDVSPSVASVGNPSGGVGGTPVNEAGCSGGYWSAKSTFTNSSANSITVNLVSGSHTGAGGAGNYPTSFSVPANSSIQEDVTHVYGGSGLCGVDMNRIDSVTFGYTDVCGNSQQINFPDIEYNQ